MHLPPPETPPERPDLDSRRSNRTSHALGRTPAPTWSGGPLCTGGAGVPAADGIRRVADHRRGLRQPHRPGHRRAPETGRRSASSGLENYQTLFADSDFWVSLGNTAFFVLIGVPTIVVISLLIALGLDHSQSRYFRALRSFYFLPAITAIVAISLIWGYLYNSQFGLLNYVLGLVGLGPVPWLSDPFVSKLSVAIVAIWRATGLNIIIFLPRCRGSQGVSRSGRDRWGLRVANDTLDRHPAALVRHPLRLDHDPHRLDAVLRRTVRAPEMAGQCDDICVAVHLLRRLPVQ